MREKNNFTCLDCCFEEDGHHCSIYKYFVFRKWGNKICNKFILKNKK